MHLAAQALALALAGTAEAQIESAPLDPPEGLAPAPEFRRPFVPMGPKLPERIDPVQTAEHTGARLRMLDKMTGEARTATLAANETVTLNRLEVTLLRCLAPDDGSLRGTKAFLEIRDLGHEGGAEGAEEGEAPLPRGAAFVDAQRPGRWRGWMLADSPALSALDHPRYDLWLISCTTSETGVASESE
jgi:hypothetical protein